MLTRGQIIKAFERMSDILRDRRIVGEVNVVGGTAMVLGFQARQSTKDVDAIFAPSSEIRKAAAQVAEELHLPADWINDAAKGFASPNGSFEPVRGVNFSNLRLLVPTAEYLLSMKVIASRAGAAGDRGDRQDIEFLLRRLGLKTPAEVMKIVERYYSPSLIPPRAMYLVDEIFEAWEKSE